MTDVVERLASVQPLPRGERMAREFDAYQPGCAPRSARWWRWMINSLYIARVWGEGSSGIRAHAAPLRKCREERKRLHKEVLFLEQHALDAVDNDNALRTEIASLRLSKEETAILDEEKP